MRRKVLYLAIHLSRCRQVANASNRWHGGHTTVGKSYVAEVIKANAAEIAVRRREMRRRRPPELPANHTWALDLTFLASPAGGSFTILGILDHGSRRVLELRALPGKCAFLLLARLFEAMARHGLPAAIRTDNESMFTGRLWGFTLKALGIIHRRAPPGQPWRNGRIERLFGTLKPLLRSVGPVTALALQRALDEFSGFYNHVRPHQGLAGRTPMEAWHGQTLADVQHATASGGRGRWVQALGGLLMGYHVRR